MTSIHPVSLLARTDCDCTTLYHSFFMLDLSSDGREVTVFKKIPPKRYHLDDIESGLKLFAINTDGNSNIEKCSSSVLTISDGSRYPILTKLEHY